MVSYINEFFRTSLITSVAILATYGVCTLGDAAQKHRIAEEYRKKAMDYQSKSNIDTITNQMFIESTNIELEKLTRLEKLASQRNKYNHKMTWDLIRDPKRSNVSYEIAKSCLQVSKDIDDDLPEKLRSNASQRDFDRYEKEKIPVPRIKDGFYVPIKK